MSDEAQIVNRIVVQGIDEAKAQVQSLRQMLLETKGAFEQARRSDDQQGIFQGSTKSAEELKRLVNEIQAQIKRLNAEISQGDVGTREKALNEELRIRQRIAQQAEQQNAKELADQRSLVEQMAKARETSMDRTAAREKSMNDTQVARMNSSVEQEIQARQRALDYESNARQKLAKVQADQAAKDAFVSSIGAVGSQASYAKQMSTLSANIEEQYRAFKRGSLGSSEYAAALDKYTKGMSVAKAEQESFSKSIGTYTSAWDNMRARVASHASWIVAGGLIGGALAIPAKLVDDITKMDTAMAGVNQVLDHTNTASRAASKGISEQAEQQNMLNSESDKFLTIAAQYGESVTNIIEAGKLWGRLYKDINVVNALTAQSAKLAVADNFSMMDANRAAESAMFQFGMTARNVTEAIASSGRVIDTWTKLAHNGGASAQDLSQGVERAGSAAHQTGVDFEFLSAQVATGVRATGRSGAEIGNMLKTLYGSIHTKDAIAQLDALGISVYKIGDDGSKQFRKAQDVLLDLSVTAQGSKQSMEEVYKSIAGGKMQWSKAAATLGDYKSFISTWGQAVNSVGFTDKQVGMQLDTISRRLGTLKADLMSMNVSAGQNGLATVIKDTITFVDRFVVGLKQIPAWSIEAAAGLGVAAKAFGVLKGAIVATNVASMASRATPLGLALTALGVAAGFAVEHLGALSNAERDATAKATDQIAIAQQQEQQMERQVEFSDALMGAHQKLQEQIESTTEGTEAHNKAVENQQETEKQLTNILGEAAVERIKDANWSMDAYDKEKQAFEDGVSAKKKALQEMIDARIQELEGERQVIQTAIDNYYKDAASFKDSIELKAKYLGWWKAIQMEYAEWKIGNAQSGVNQLQKQIDEVDQAIADGGDNELLSRRKEILQGQLEQESDSLTQQQEAYQSAISQGSADLEGQKNDLDNQLINLRQQSINLSQAPSGLKIAPESTTKEKGTKSMPTDQTEAIQKKLENYEVKSIEDQAAIAQDAYKSRLDAITDATNRYGKSYAFLDQTIGSMNKHVGELKNTSAQLDEQLKVSMGKVNELASETGATITVTGASDDTPEGTAWNFFTSKGYSPELASGIIGNLMTESGLNPGVWAGDNSGSYGIGQWLGERLQGLKDFAASRGTAIDDLNTQLAYVDYELKNGESEAFKSISNSDLSQPEGAAYAVSKYYERPAWAANPERQKNARDVYDKYLNGTGSRQIYVNGLNDTLTSAGVSQESWKGMSAESKKQFISDHKDQVKDANLLIGYLNTISGIEKKRAEIEKEIAKTVKDEYTARIKGIQEVEGYQQKLADHAKRSHLSTLGYYATDTDKAIAEQVATQQKLAASNAALEYAKKHGINIFTDQTMSEERVKNLELQAQVEQQSTFGTPEARYKQRLAEIEYQQKLSQAQIEGDQTSPMNTQAKLLSNIDAAKGKVKALTDLLKEMQARDPFANQTEEFKKYNLELKEAQKNAKELAETYSTKMRQGVYDVTNELLLQGKKISDIWGDLWKQLANDALKALMRIKNDSPGLLAQALGAFGGAKGAQQKQKANSWSDYANVIGVTANTWGTGSSYKAPTKAAEDNAKTLATAEALGKEIQKTNKKSSGFDTSQWNALAKMTSAFPSAAERGASGVYSGDYNTKNTAAAAAPKQSGGIAWGSILGSLAGLFHAKGGVVDTPSIAGEDGEEVIIPTQKNTQNSKSLLGYAAGKLGVSSGGLTADFSSKDIAKTAMNISVSSATNMAKTNAILATQNQILTTMLNNMGQQQGQTNVIIAGSGDTSMESQASAYSTLVARRYISK